MIGVVATLKVQEAKADEFEAVFRDLTAQVKANEPGCLTYQLTKSRNEPNTYKVLEIYASEDALKHHAGTEYFVAAMPKMGPCLAGPPHIDTLDAVE